MWDKRGKLHGVTHIHHSTIYLRYLLPCTAAISDLSFSVMYVCVMLLCYIDIYINEISKYLTKNNTHAVKCGIKKEDSNIYSPINKL